jgi:hypothetical protein
VECDSEGRLPVAGCLLPAEIAGVPTGDYEYFGAILEGSLVPIERKHNQMVIII